MRTDRADQIQEMAQRRVTDPVTDPPEVAPAPKRQIKGCFVKPNGYRLIVERDQFKYSGVVYIPDAVRHLPTTGIVVSVPEDGCLDQWLGKRVIWSQLSGTPISFKNMNKYFAMQIEEIIGEITIPDELSPEVEVGGGYGS